MKGKQLRYRDPEGNEQTTKRTPGGVYQVGESKVRQYADGRVGTYVPHVPNFDRRTKRSFMRKTGMSSRQFVRFRKAMKRAGKW